MLFGVCGLFRILRVIAYSVVNYFTCKLYRFNCLGLETRELILLLFCSFCLDGSSLPYIILLKSIKVSKLADLFPHSVLVDLSVSMMMH